MRSDPIERRLRQLNEQGEGFAGRMSNHIFAKSPMAVCAVGMVCGTAVQGIFDFDIRWWIAVSVVTTAASLTAGGYLKADKRVWAGFAGAFILTAALGAARMDGFYRVRHDDIRNFASGENTLAEIKGTVISPVRFEDRESWVFGKYVWDAPSSSFYLKLTEAKFQSGWAKVSGTVRVQVGERCGNISAGDTVKVFCRLDRFDHASNPGQFDVAEYLKRRGVFLSATVKSSSGVSKIRQDRDKRKIVRALLKIKHRLRIVAEGSLLGEGYFEQTDQGLAAALLLGKREQIKPDTYRAFVKTGLAHFISLSGLHMGLVAGMVWWISKAAGLTKRPRAAVTIAVIGLYTLVLEPKAPTLRAAVMCAVFCLSIIARRKINSLNALSLAAVVLLLIRPTDVFNAGWQLSFSTVLGIILLNERIYLRLSETFFERFDFFEAGSDENIFRILTGRLANAAIAMVSVGLSAWAAGAGVLAYHFGSVTPTACIWTMVVFPIVAVLLGAGFLQIVLSFLLPTLAIAVGMGTEKISDVLSLAVRAISHIDKTQINTGSIGLSAVLMYYIGLTMLILPQSRRKYLRKIIAAAAILLMTIPSIAVIVKRNACAGLEMTCLDVGHGQAIVITTCKGENILVDAGSLTTSNCGARIAAPFLKEKGIGKLDAVFISHDDLDHLNGIPEVVAGVKTDGVYVNQGFMQKTRGNSGAGYLKGWLAEHNIKFESVRSGIEKIKGVKIRPLWPNEQVCSLPNVSDNDKSQVLLIEYAGKTILICGDIETMPQQRILRDNPGLKADVVVMPHHGSKINLQNDFYERLSAKYLIASCGKSRYPTAYKNDKFRSFYTAADGAVSVRISEDGEITVFCHRGHREKQRLSSFATEDTERKENVEYRITNTECQSIETPVGEIKAFCHREHREKQRLSSFATENTEIKENVEYRITNTEKEMYPVHF